MSEYQYYEFRAVDRPLQQKEMNELRALSTRAEITLTSFSNEYNYGDFRGNPDTLMDKYFDAFVYVANWGTHRLVLRVPLGVLDGKTAEQFRTEEMLRIRRTKTHLILDFESQDEDGEWENGEGWMEALLPVRQEIMAGDLRSLYLAWLGGVQLSHGLFHDEEGTEGNAEGGPEPGDDALSNRKREPPLPPGLTKLSPAHSRLAEYLRLDPDLIAAAAQGSGSDPVTAPTDAERAAWITGLSDKEKTALLVRLVSGESAVQAEVQRRFLEQWRKSRRPAGTDVPRRTVGELRSAYLNLVARKQAKAKEKAARDKAKRDAEAAKQREKHLDALEQREEQAWNQVEVLVSTKQPKHYGEAVQLLRDLFDLAERRFHSEPAIVRIQQLRQRHAAKRTFVQRLDKVGLP